MNRVICVKGHFYDGDKYDACPHCAAGVAAVAQSAFAVKYGENTEETKSEKGSGKKEIEKAKKEKKGLFGRKNSQAARQEAAKAESEETLLLHDAVTGPVISQPIVGQPIAAQLVNNQTSVSQSAGSSKQSLSAAFSWDDIAD